MSYRVRIDSFEGPFDLLLHLVSRRKVDIGSISVAQIVDQYLAHVDGMEELDLDVASDFLLVASKSRRRPCCRATPSKPMRASKSFLPTRRATFSSNA